MNENLKFYLLAEQLGWDCSEYAYKRRDDIYKSASYSILKANMSEVSKHISKRSQYIQEEYKKLDEEPLTLKDFATREIRCNYLALHSFPEYYINPLTIEKDYQGVISSLGDLIFQIDSKEMTLNSLLLSNDYSFEKKQQAIDDQLEDYLSDLDEMTDHAIEAIKENSLNTSLERKEGRRTIVSEIIFIILNILFAFIYIYPNIYFRECMYSLSSDKILSYLSLIYPIFMLLYDISYILYFSYRSRKYQSYNYAKRFIKKNSSKVYQSNRITKEALKDYILNSIKQGYRLQNDIKSFSLLSTGYIDYKKVLDYKDIKKSPTMKAFRTVYNILSAISILLSLLTFVLYIISIVLKKGI